MEYTRLMVLARQNPNELAALVGWDGKSGLIDEHRRKWMQYRNCTDKDLRSKANHEYQMLDNLLERLYSRIVYIDSGAETISTEVPKLT